MSLLWSRINIRKENIKMFYASKKYKVICLQSCYHVKNIKLENLITYETMSEAIKDGCRPCKHCMKDIAFEV